MTRKLDAFSLLYIIPKDFTEEEFAAACKNLEADSSDFELRAKVMGYFYYVAQNDEWQSHYVWLVENAPLDPFVGEVSANLILDALHEDFYKNVCKLWMEQVEKHSANPQVYLNAAAAVLISDCAESRRLFECAKRLEPKKPELLRFEKQLLHLERCERIWSNSEAGNSEDADSTS
ncbi:MAG TPA: hypothetical protein V6C76_03760 [Drouetiella sp.]